MVQTWLVFAQTVICVTMSSKTNPFQRGSEIQIVNPEVQAQSLGISNQSSKHHSSKQITNLSTSSTDALYVYKTICSVGTTDLEKLTGDCYGHNLRREKAPQIDPFTAEDIGITFDDSPPILEQAAIWNEWIPEEPLIQLAGHLRGRALQEWKLLFLDDKANYYAAIQGLLWSCQWWA